jgi:hypothetical protein
MTALARRSFVLALAVGASAPQGASAQDSPHERAAAAFSAARALIDAGDCKAAIPKLLETLSHELSIGAYFSLADCHGQVDLLVAWRDVKAAEALAVQRQDERIHAARRRLAELESKLPTFRLTVPPSVGAATGVAIRLDDRVIGPEIYGDGVIAAAPGAHNIEVTAPHKKTFHRQVVASPPNSGGVVADVTIELGDDAPTPVGLEARAPAPQPHDGLPRSEGGGGIGSQRTIALVLGGVAAVGIAVGAVAGIVALNGNGKVRQDCGGRTVSPCTPVAGTNPVGDASQTRAVAAVSTIGFVAGGAAMAGALVLWFSAPRARERVAIAPMVSASLGGISASGQF